VAAATDPLTYVLDPGREYQRTVFAGGPTWASPGDGIHLDAVRFNLQRRRRAITGRNLPAVGESPPGVVAVDPRAALRRS
jgi:hypothetical protein